MKLSIVHKVSLGSIALVLISSSTVGGLFYVKMTDTLVNNALQQITSDVENAGRALQQIVNANSDDVLFISELPPFKTLVKDKSKKTLYKQQKKIGDEWILAVESTLRLILEKKKKYLGLSFIDVNGLELVSVQRNQTQIESLKGQQLQNVRHKDYISKALNLPSGDVYLSNIRLRKISDSLTKNFQEVIHMVTPIYYQESNHILGVIEITVQIGSELKVIQDSIKSVGNRKIFITNDKGGYLLHPIREFTFGFEHGKRFHIQEDLPQLAELYLPDNDQTKPLILMPENTDGQKVINFTKISFDRVHTERFIAVVMIQKYSDIVEEVSKTLNEVTTWASALIIVAAGLTFLFSIRITRPIDQIVVAINEFRKTRTSKFTLPVKLNNEVGVLAKAFSEMIFEVKKSQTALEALNLNLETRVKERTEDLNDARIDAENANRAKSLFLSSMSHELRTPLNAILGFAQLLQIDHEILNDSQIEYVNEIYIAGKHLLKLVSEVLDLARIESGTLEVNITTVVVEDAIKQCFSLMRPLASSRNIVLSESVNSKGYKVLADDIRLKQVLVNLLSNAVKYNREGGKILVSSEIFEKKYLRLTVKDTGVGLSEENIAKLFTPFERFHKNDNIEGAGIGLVITKRLVELMKGQIGVESQVGKGASFWIQLRLDLE